MTQQRQLFFCKIGYTILQLDIAGKILWERFCRRRMEAGAEIRGFCRS